MRLITTHVGADFDALASMIAARRLHPDGELFFPGSKEESVRRMLDSGYFQIEELKQRQIDPRQIRSVVLCDMRQAGRLGAVAEWLDDRSEVERVAYDHHPDAEDDLEVTGGIVDPQVGATSTLMAEEFVRLEIVPTPTEATLMLAGIYEDTGSLSYTSTKPRDLRAAATLLEWGADLETVRRWAVKELDADDLAVLHRLLQRLEVHRLRGRRIGVTSIELGGFVEEVAPLVSRVLELTNLPAIVALIGEEDRVSVIARGGSSGVHLGDLLERFADGGGHPTAAAASLRGITALEAREELLRRLPDLLPPAPTAGDLMTRPYIGIDAGSSVVEARQSLVAARINAAPVEDSEKRVQGIATRQLLDGAEEHGLGERPVTTAMTSEVEWVTPEAEIESLLEPIRRGAARLLLVGDAASGRLAGVLPRSTVLRQLAGRLAEHEIAQVLATHRVEAPDPEALIGALPADLAGPVETARQLAAERGEAISLVGGLVRDLVLNRPNRDLDLVVEGDAPAFARELAERLGGRVSVHDAFMTAVVAVQDGVSIDLATARSESYPEPASLPQVRSGPLRQDLYRRDFTVNTLALRFDANGVELLDYFGGLADLEAEALRVLHSLSFIDDPTRAFRAVRLEARLGFRITEETRRLLRVALEEGVFARLSETRLREELKRLLGDADTAVPAVQRLGQLGLLQVLHPELRPDESTMDRLRAAHRALQWRRLEEETGEPIQTWRLFLLALGADLPQAAQTGLAKRLGLGADDRATVARSAETLNRVLAELGEPRLAPHAAGKLLEGRSEEERLLLLGMSEGVARGRIHDYLTHDRLVEPEIDGNTLIAAGAAAGPALGRALEEVRWALIDRRIESDPEAELAFGLQVWRREAGGNQ